MVPFFSVILPIYNVKPWLSRCVDSVLAQGFTDYELLLVDDGATDGSGALCDELALRDSRIRVIHKENGGLSSARNAGAAEAVGKYIWWVDSDDWITPDALEQLHEAITQSDADMVKFSYIRVEGTNQKHIPFNAEPGLYTVQQQEVLLEKAFLSTSRFGLSAWSYVYRTSFLRENELCFVSERQVGSEDYLFNLVALLKAQRVQVIDNALYYYELRLGSLSQRYKKDLPVRFTALFTHLCEAYKQSVAWQTYGSRICTFYVWHLMRGTCIPNEYYVTQDHTLTQGRRNIRAFLRTKAVRRAARQCQSKHFSKKEKLQLLALKLGAEPLFYRLYVVRSSRRKGTRDED